MTYNQKNVQMNLKRIDICDLEIACSMMAQETGADKWFDLHEKPANILADFDEKHIDEWA